MTTEPTPAAAAAPQAPKGANAFLMMSLVFVCASALWMAASPSLFLEAGVQAQSKAWTYLTLYGFAMPAVFGLIYRSLPMAFGAPLLSEKFIALHLAFHIAGFALVFFNTILPEPPQPLMGQSFLACGVVVFLVNAGTALHKRGLAEPSSAFLATSLLWLAVSTAMGLPLANDPLIGALKETHWASANLELLLLGFVMNAVLGLSLRLTRMRLDSPPRTTGTAWLALALTNAGLAWLFGAITYGPPGFAMFCVAVYCAGTLAFLARFMAITQDHRAKILDWDTKMLLTALWVMPAVGLLAGWAAWLRMDNPEHPPVRLETAAALTAILAAAVPCLIALTCQSGALLRGVSPDEEPSAHLRLSSYILLASFFNYATGVCLVLAGAGIGVEKMSTLGALFLLVGTLGFLGHLLHAKNEKPAAARPAQSPA